jgi:hemolysin III
VGLLFKTFFGARYDTISTGLYLAMGWLVVIAIKPLWLAMPVEGLVWLAVGGLSYTVGVLFYAFDRIRYAHFVWHLFVIGGTVCHFVAVMLYAG